jgi:hypothetical protein
MTSISRIAKILSHDELRKYFVGEGWKDVKWGDDDSFSGESENYTVKFSPKFSPSNEVWRLKVEAVDDPSDSLDEVTPDPVKALAKFLSEGLPGGETFEKMASSPARMAAAMRLIAASGPPARAVRRLVVAASSVAVEADLGPIESKLKSKGWRVEKKGDSLVVDVSGRYEATITPSDEMWEYEFGFKHDDSMSKSGETDDPIMAFRKWKSGKNIQGVLEGMEIDARADDNEARARTRRKPKSLEQMVADMDKARSDADKAAEKAAEVDSSATVRPGRR